MKTSSKLRRLQRMRELKRQRRRFFSILMVVFVLFAHSAFSKQESADDKVEVITVTVEPGDTLWEIALEYKKAGEDTRDFMYEIAATNGVKDCNIVSGQLLYIPVSK